MSATADIQKQKHSSSTNGQPILVAATADSGTLIHTAIGGTTQGTYDEIFIWAYNNSATPVNITIEFGGNSSNNLITMSVPAYSMIQVIPGFILQDGLMVRAYAGTTNVILIGGYVNAITA